MIYWIQRKEAGTVRVPFGRFLSMFAAGDPRAEEFFRISVTGVAILAAVIVLLVVIHIRRRRKSDELAREIMEKCEEDDRRSW